jgi:transposase-like protein
MNLKLTTSLCKTLLELLEQGQTLAEVCRTLGISPYTVRRKCKQDENFNAAYTNAKQAGYFQFQELARDKSRKAILRRIEGYTVVETTKQTDAEGNVISQTHREKHVPSSVPLLLACLRHLEGWNVGVNADADPDAPTVGLPSIVFMCPPRTDTPLPDPQNLN